MRNKIIVFTGIMMSAIAAGSTLLAQTTTNDLTQLTHRVDQLEKQVQEITQFLEPLKGQQSIISNRRAALKERVQNRFELDRDKYTPEQVLEAEKLYDMVSGKPNSPEASQCFETLIKKYPQIDRTGCAALYVAQRAQGDARVKYLQDCIEKYNDCMYGDGVQVGAYARFLLAHEYITKGEDKQAEALYTEIKSAYADAIDHGGNLLVDLQGRITK